MKTNTKEYWRSLNELSNNKEFRKYINSEFPAGLNGKNPSELNPAVSRRRFLSLAAASLGLAGFAGCRRPVEKIIPYVYQPESVIPGNPLYYATTMPFGNNAYGILVESHEGRPTKIEGNKLHPSSLGASNTFMQASILELYDPDRSSSVINNSREKTWKDFLNFWQSLRRKFTENKGKGLAVISGSFSSPSLFRLTEKFKSIYPEAMWITYEPISDENIFKGIDTAAGKTFMPEYKFENAEVVLSLDSDFLNTESENVRNSLGFSKSRDIDNNGKMSRLYVAESRFSITGGMADHRIKIPVSNIGAFTVLLAKELNNLGLSIKTIDNLIIDRETNFDKNWLKAAAEDLYLSKGRAILIAGRDLEPEIHTLVFSINDALGNIGNTILYREPLYSSFPDTENLKEAVNEIKKGSVSTVVIIGSNPVYTAPVDLDFESAIKNVENVIHCGMYKNETAEYAHWHLPMSHFLEYWGDAAAFDGTLSVIQPLIEPLFNGKSPFEFLNMIIEGTDLKGYNIIRDTWKNIIKENNFEKSWMKVLHDGLYDKSKIPETKIRLSDSRIAASLKEKSFYVNDLSSDNLEINFYPSAVFDGRFANNGWLQEMPDPVTKITWDNPALISPETAEELSLTAGDFVTLKFNNKELIIPVLVIPGQADYTISLALGYGKTSGGRIERGTGFNTYLIRVSNNLYCGTGLILKKAGGKYKIACTQDHHSMEGRPFIIETNLKEYKKHPSFLRDHGEHSPQKSMWKERKYDKGYQWAMAVDLNKCTGCGTCIIACQSENNIPVIGKSEVFKGREMHWLRVDRYFEGEPEDPKMVHQPLACQHCELAPCEQVCPVAATVHDEEGLNNMVYNRCIGTRYCSNNCPFKVRRFNFFDYTGGKKEIEKMAMNPDVTIRSRGVMEKCTYCIQRLSRAKIEAKLEGENISGLKTACQQSCPSQAIVFGNINDKNSRIYQIKNNNRNYELLTEMNLKSRTSYLAKIRNPNPELEKL